MTICLLAGWISGMGNLMGQQSPVFSQYVINGFVVNPALAGIDGTFRMSIAAHDYLIGLKNGPKTFTATANGRLLISRAKVSKGKYVAGRSGKVGMGGLIYSDFNGLIKRTGIQYTYAYHVSLNLDRTSHLSFGLSAAISQTKIDAPELQPHEYEPLLANGFHNTTYVPDAVLGAVYRYKSSYVGLTASNLFQRSFQFKRNEFDYDYVMYRHYFLMAGSTIELNNDYLFTPSLLAKVTSNGVYQAEISTMLAFRDDVWLAFSYRTPNIASAMIGFRAGKVYAGYAYEYNFGSIRTISNGRQELVLMYRIGDPTRRYRWGNRF